MADNLQAILEAIPVPAPRQIGEDEDGWLFDSETGEVLGRSDIDERFEIDNAHRAEWALKLRSELEGEEIACTVRMQGLIAQLEAMLAGHRRRKAWWEYRFAPSLATFARSLLKGRSRTAQFNWGKVGFRSTAGTHEILDMEAAVAWMRTWSPEKVKRVVTETVAVKDVLAVQRAVAEEFGEDPPHLPWLKTSGPQESVTISTGINVKGIEE